MAKIVYASRTGHVEKIIRKPGLENVLKIQDGSERLMENM